ncbi:hypothetical protein MVES1_000796 [Malassezia vespertilionis]|uniref:Altered inheritance of mitochondria protein 6 n=1 Tax=Malassezia vespertilionis TaxID=2020962 RepID=A0A2N1JEQ5_9BASI|nr:uncharacterized protein MVES1_000796 [Malassezia vespertilionis]PKI85032.1 Aim6p [Malassezia vespertilionis]WFD05466.1 hypothetical protein MVES1_000796 [Malassezia vespertilionis]
MLNPWILPFVFVGSAIASKLAPSSPEVLLDYEPFGGKNASILKSPADWNRNTYPIFVHSHNDYERRVPVLEALSYGALSIESDVWLNPKDEVLYVGHDPFSLTTKRTFHAITVKPLMQAIDQANTANAVHVRNDASSLFADLQASVATKDSPWWNGYYSLGVGNTQPIQLMVDIKNDAENSWKKVLSALEPLRKRGYLTRYEYGKVIPGPIIVVGAGATPIEQVAGKHKRDVFYDCQLAELRKPGPKVQGIQYEWNSTLCPIASGDFASITGDYTGVHMPSKKINESISSVVREAHKRGIKTRFWDTPAWPAYARDRVNKLLLELGSDWINADDLSAIAKF